VSVASDLISFKAGSDFYPFAGLKHEQKAGLGFPGLFLARFQFFQIVDLPPGS
jgi:hypothetical protein